MRAILIIDRDFAHRELRLMRKVAIGLVDAGWRTILALPVDMTQRFADVPGVRVVGYRDRGVPWTRSLRAREIAEQTDDTSDEPGVVHAFGGRGFGIACDVARQLRCPLVLETHARALVPNAAAVLGECSSPGMALVPSPQISSALIAAGVPSASVREVSWGVSSRDARTDRDPSEVLGVVLAGTGSDPVVWEAAVRGLALVASRREDFVILADDVATQRAGIDKLVSSLGLSPLFSRIPQLEAERQLVLRADVMLWPDHDGEHRSIILDAMASGVAVVGTEDRDVPAMSDPSVAMLVAGDASEWAGAVEAMVSDQTRRRELGQRAHEYVAQHHRPSKHVSALLDAYEWMLGKDAVPLVRDES